VSTLTAHELLEACRKPGCPVCRLEQRTVERYLDNQFYENVNSTAFRDRLRASLGFCHEHAWLAVDERLGDALGFTIIYRDVINGILSRLEEPAMPRREVSLRKQIPEQVRNRVARVLHTLVPQKRCPACQHREEAMRNIVTELVNELGSPEMVEALRASDGLCLAHLRSALEHARDVSAVETMIDIHRVKLEGLKAELDEFIRKSDYQFAGEGFGTEGDAWLRALGTIVGGRWQK
jgi:hypothetical protein